MYSLIDSDLQNFSCNLQCRKGLERIGLIISLTLILLFLWVEPCIKILYLGAVY